jgi:plastocyanin
MTAGGVTRWRRLTFVLVAAIAVLSYAGLRAAAGESATEPPSFARAGDSTVGIANFKFKPTPLTVQAGTKVSFDNRSRVTHTATANGGAFDTGDIKPGEDASVTFKRPGTYVFHCEIHPFMHGKIIVK